VTDAGVTVTTAGGTGSSTATGFFAQTFVYSADYVVVTVPLGVLQASAIAFTPALSTTKTFALSLVGMGTMEKVFLQFATPFWTANAQRIGYVSSPKGAFSTTYNIHYFTNKPILVMVNAGAYGVTTAAMTDGQVLTAAMKTLRLLYGGKNNTIPFYTKYMITRWKADPYSLGSFSFSKVGSAQPAHRDSLAVRRVLRMCIQDIRACMCVCVCVCVCGFVRMICASVCAYVEYGHMPSDNQTLYPQLNLLIHPHPTPPPPLLTSHP
jgi:monoamine oxidase